MPIKEKFDFTLKHYEHCIKLSKEKDYVFFRMHESEKANHCDKALMMRHDVDTQLDIALKMAEIESSLSVPSTFFIRLHSHAYSPMCIKDAKKIRRIASLGHEIGLHYEPDYYSLLGKSFNDFVKLEIELLSAICELPIRSIAPHEPTRSGIKKIDDETAKLLGITTQAYDSIIMKKFKYISDSSCNWREGSWFYHINNELYKKLYVLTHPYWWYDSSPIENY